MICTIIPWVHSKFPKVETLDHEVYMKIITGKIIIVGKKERGISYRKQLDSE